MGNRVGMGRRCAFWMAFLILVVVLNGCRDGLEGPPAPTEFPENPGYLRAAHPRGGELIIFDADTFEIYRKVELPPSGTPDSHRLEIGPAGRIWIGFSRGGKDASPEEVNRVLVFSRDGGLEHELDLGCSSPDAGIAFANGYAFVGCRSISWSRVIVIDLSTMEPVKTFDRILPPLEDAAERGFYITAVAEVAGSILVAGWGRPPEDYQRLTNHSAGTTAVGVIDPETLIFRGFLTGLNPGLRVLSVLEVDGNAWLFNELGHMAERLPRIDVYVMDPRAMEIVDSFNLERPFPVWAQHGDDGTIYIYHGVSRGRWRDAGYRRGLTRLDPVTGAGTFFLTPDGGGVRGMGVYRSQPCLALALGGSILITPGPGKDPDLDRKVAEARRRAANNGLWCMDGEGGLELKIRQRSPVGVAFGPHVPGG